MYHFKIHIRGAAPIFLYLPYSLSPWTFDQEEDTPPLEVQHFITVILLLHTIFFSLVLGKSFDKMLRLI